MPLEGLLVGFEFDTINYMKLLTIFKICGGGVAAKHTISPNEQNTGNGLGMFFILPRIVLMGVENGSHSEPAISSHWEQAGDKPPRGGANV